MKDEKKIVLTGDRPTGPLHLGHYVGSLHSRIELQDGADQYVMIADLQALTDHTKEPDFIRKNVLQVALDYLAVGIDPKKTVIFIQSLIPPLTELTLYYLNLVTWNRLKHNPTVKQEIIHKGFGESVPAGFMVYPVFQAADITAFKANCVPVGEDQLPMIEQTNEIVRSFNRTYQKDVLVVAEAFLSRAARLPGTDGGPKMSKTLNNAIYLSDTSDQVKKKVQKMYSDPRHLRVEDPGRVEGNPLFYYLDAFGRDASKIDQLKDHYRKGGMGDSVVKKYLLDVLIDFLGPIQERRALFEKDLGGVMDILRSGSAKALERASATLVEVRSAMGLTY